MNTDLDDQLAGSDPAGQQRTPAARAALEQLIADTERVVSRRRRRRAAGVGAAALSVAVLGGAGAAAASGAWSPGGWWNDSDATSHQVVSESGSDCQVTYAPRAVRDPAHPVSAEDQSAAMAAATDFLRRFDDAALDGLSSNAVADALNERVTQALSRQGLSTYAVSVALATDCETGTGTGK